MSENTLRKHREWLAGKYEVDAYLSSSTTDPDTCHPALEVAGSINLELLSDDELHEVEKILNIKKGSLEIYRECDRYITESALQASMLSCFH